MENTGILGYVSELAGIVTFWKISHYVLKKTLGKNVSICSDSET